MLWFGAYPGIPVDVFLLGLLHLFLVLEGALLFLVEKGKKQRKRDVLMLFLDFHTAVDLCEG